MSPLRTNSIRVKLSTEAFEGLSEIATRNGTTPETLAGNLLNSLLETLYGPRVSEAEEPVIESKRWGNVFNSGISVEEINKAFREFYDTVGQAEPIEVISEPCTHSGLWETIEKENSPFGYTVYRCEECNAIFDSPYEGGNRLLPNFETPF